MDVEAFEEFIMVVAIDGFWTIMGSISREENGSSNVEEEDRDAKRLFMSNLCFLNLVLCKIIMSYLCGS